MVFEVTPAHGENAERICGKCENSDCGLLTKEKLPLLGGARSGQPLSLARAG